MTTDQPAMDNLSKIDEAKTNNLSSIEEISELNDSTVNNMLNASSLFVLDCYAPWCEPCKELSAVLYELSDELKGQVAFGTIDIERNYETTRKYNISIYPTLLYFKNGTLVDSQIGYGSKSELVMRLKMLKPDLNTSQVKPDEARIMPGPVPLAFRQFVENASTENTSIKNASIGNASIGNASIGNASAKNALK